MESWFYKRIRTQCCRPDFSWKGVILFDPCVYCGAIFPRAQDEPDWRRRQEPWRWQSVEHILPTSRGGTQSWENKAAACYWCNVRRENKPLLAYLGRTARSD